MLSLWRFLSRRPATAHRLPPLRRRPLIEALEDRLVPTTFFPAAPFTHGELWTEGTGGANVISVWREGNDLVIQEDGDPTPFRTDYQNVTSYTIRGGGGNDEIYIYAIQADTNIPVLINGQGGYDQIYLGAGSHSLEHIEPALITVDGGGTGTDSARLVIWDDQDGAASSYSITATDIDHANGEPVFYSRVDQIDLYTTETYIFGPISPHHIDILGTAAGTHIDIHVGLPDTQINIGGDENPGGSLSNLAGSVTIFGHGAGNQVNFKDTWATAAGNFQIGNEWVTKLFPGGSAQVYYSNVGPVTFEAGPHNDVFTVDWWTVTKGLTIHGNAGNDRLVGYNGTNNTFTVTGAGAATLNNKVVVDSFYHLQGGNIRDVFAMTPGAAFGGHLDGGAGIDFLDYSAFTAGVNVTLIAGGGSSRVEGIIGGSGNDSLSGDVADNILIGGGGNDTLRGFDGRDLLIGGVGADILDGGRDEDILIGGATQYDANPKALAAILMEWTEQPLERFDYFGQINRLTETGSPTSGFRYPLISSTMPKDTDKDKLTGGSDLDWFFGDIGEVIDREKFKVGTTMYLEQID